MSSQPAPTKTTSAKKSALLDDRTRLKRNAGEKRRRDKLNNYISELSAMVPSCRMPQSQRKLDKSTILKLTVSYMKLHADLLPESIDDKNLSWKPSFLSNEELGQLMLEALDGFLFVIWSTGRTIFVSESITPLLGHLQQDVLDTNFLELIHPEDISLVKDKMFPPDSPDSGYIEELGTPSPSSTDSNSPSSTTDAPVHLRRHFQARMRRGGFTSKAEYEMVYCSGHLRKWNEVTRSAPVDPEKCDPLPQDGFCLVGVGRLQCTQTIREMTPGAPLLNTWTSHHSLDAKYIHIDQSAASIIGYKRAELLGSSAYNLYHDADLNALARSHINLNKTGSGMTCLYRFLTKGQQWLWIKTQGSVRYHEGTKQPHSIVCQNIVVSYAEVWQYLQNKARQYGPDEPKMLAAAPLDTKAEVTLDHIKVEQYSPNQSIDGKTYYQTSPYNPSTPSPLLKAAYPTEQNCYEKPSNTSFYASPPNYVGFSTTEYFPPAPTTIGEGNTFKDLFPNYKPSLSTEETHGRYRPLGGAESNSPPCQYQTSMPAYAPVKPLEDVKPVYIGHPHQSFLQTINSPPPITSSAARVNHVTPPAVAMVTSPNNMTMVNNTYAVAPSPGNMPVKAVPYVMAHSMMPHVVHGAAQMPHYASAQHMMPTMVQNVDTRGGLSHVEEPVVGMPVSTGYSVQHHHSLVHHPPSGLPNECESPPAKKGVSVYGGLEKRPAPPSTLNSCAQMSHKRVRNDQALPPYIKPAAQQYQPFNNTYYTPTHHPTEHPLDIIPHNQT